ncbi:dephospho-CoA kinase [Candidatus Latescibacterota bacterium]
MILGITGCPGSGKSLLASEIEKHGWVLIDADEIGREVVESSSDILKNLADAFGSDIVDSDGKLDRRLLAKRVFGNIENTNKLNKIVHPPLIKRLKSSIKEVISENRNGVIDCALIFEWDIEDIFDFVICAAADERLRKKRLMERDGRSSEEVENLFSAQLLESEKMRKADIVLKNNDSIERMKIFSKMLAELPRIEKVLNDG